ncbi:MAG: hypothetical protein WBE80_04295 [Methylocella sp.]
MATFYRFGQLWEIPPAAARLGKSLPANTQAFETFLINLEPMYSAFICAHPRCPKDPDLPAVRYAIKEFMEAQAPSNFFKERWAATYDPARKVTYVSWFLGTIAYFLDKLDFTSLVPPPVETEFPVFIAEPPSAPLDPAPPQSNQAPVTSSSSAASRKSGQPSAPAAPAAQPARQSRLWNAGGPAGLAALEARNAAERQALLRQASSALARPVVKADGVQPGDACPSGEASFIPRRSGKRPPDVDDPSSWESGWN